MRNKIKDFFISISRVGPEVSGSMILNRESANPESDPDQGTLCKGGFKENVLLQYVSKDVVELF